MILIAIISSSNITILATDTDININDIETNSTYCILIDTKSNAILYSKNAYEKAYPASTTKLMTAILTLENCNLNDIVTVSHNAIFSIPYGYSHANLMEGEKLTVEQLLNVLLIPSANDAAVVLAEHISGSVENFSVLMNEKAKSLGCLNTNFVNPNGIHNENHYSTAYDLALIGKYATKFPDIMRIATTKQYTLPITNMYDKEDRIFNNTNFLINNGNKNYYEYSTGLKTGYTDKSNHCIIASAKKDDTELICVTLNAPSSELRFSDCKNLFNYAFDNYTYTTLTKANSIIKTLEIEGATKETKNLDIISKDDINILLRKNTTLEPTIEINENLQSPINQNAVVRKNFIHCKWHGIFF